MLRIQCSLFCAQSWRRKPPTSSVHTVRPTRASAARGTVPERQLARLVRGVDHRVLLRRDLARDGHVARRDIQDRVVDEEVARPQEQRHGLGGHDGEVLGRGDVRHAEGVPEHDVRVLDRLGPVADPLGQAAGGLARGLGHVPARGPELVVMVCGVVCQIRGPIDGNGYALG